ncbi:hypothetical protein BW723_14080 [Polaribacter reichenbachii]|uniref:Uncharacterized protein n=1 Tax=Polaribacter reichenbachii TaxID=996801 RepID=A0A1B8U1G0_9FLAO|nr:DUF5694 domain-containing protein [Polaribacter reichenbachii]APZ47339.1 hypothetical protein BW723_14080 [Polaribacter reichenbachii]AUC17980.1 hypothetical protein BTO17_04535 [Polaribacter reichenbachii]OBY65693.1 hypothetical protein LPB301_07700 [Polaribacter reichenbachii]
MNTDTILKKILLILSITLMSCNNTPIAEKTTAEYQSTPSDKVEVLLVGTSHWNNYNSKGLDVAQTNQMDILSPRYQSDLLEIVEKIKEFHPDKIFVERTLVYQPKLDSLFNLYSTNDWGKERRNEIYQLGFRLAKELKHERVYGVDYREMEFPYDSLMKSMKQANQIALMESFNNDIKQYETNYNQLIAEQKPLKDILYYLNDPEQRKLDLSWYLNGANKGGDLETTVGSYLASEWIKRNIYIYGLIQKYTEPKDERIMILMGASHIGVLENLISYHPEWKTVELKEIME